MAIDFPASPTNGQTFTSGSVTYTWDGTKWTAVAAGGSSNSISQGNTNATVTDTGSDGRFVVTTEGTERLRVNASGQLGVGTTPAKELHVYKSSGSTSFWLESGDTQKGIAAISIDNNAYAFQSTYNTGGTAARPFAWYNVSTELMRLDASGRLLVGTTSSSGNTILHVKGASNQLKIDSSTNAGTSSVVFTAPAVNGLTTDERAKITFSDDGTGGWGGYLAFLTGGQSPSERLRITNDGHVLIGNTSNTSSPSDGFQIYSASQNSQINIGHGNGASSGNGYLRFLYNSGVIGSISQNGTTGVSYNTSSDYRLKENVTLLTGATDRLKQLPVHRFNFIAEPGKTVDGFLAHEAAEVVPECVTGEKDAVDEEGNPIYQGIDQSKLVPLLTAALQEAVAKIESLEVKVAALESP